MREPHSPNQTRGAKLEHLLDSMLQGTCVPFLGAGMTYEADLGGGHRMRTCRLEQLLRQRLRALALQKGGPPETVGVLGTRHLSELAEVMARHYGLAEAVEAIWLNEWHEIGPTDAHRYLAFLARERLIAEVFTTNYDCLLEKALYESRAPAVPSREWPGVDVRVMRSLEEYRESGAQRGNRRQVLLHLLKLNGCACSYRAAWLAQNGSARAYRHAVAAIALTAWQLQDWRNARWREELFRDRLRTRRMLFVGFGSDDPMVRHTMMQVSEEFAGDGTGGGREEGSAGACRGKCKVPNAPFISAHRELSSNQRQVLAGFCLAHPCGSASRNRPQQGGLERGIRANACAEDWGEGQTADEFVQELYVRAIRQLWLERYFSDDSPLARYLAPLLHHADNVLLAVREALGRSTEWVGGSFGEGLRLAGGGVSPLTRAHLAAAGWEESANLESRAVNGQYVAFADEPVGLPMMYLLWVLLHNAARSGSEEPQSPVLDLPSALPRARPSGARIGEVSTGTEFEKPRQVLCRFGDPGADLGKPVPGTEAEGNHVLLITLDGRRRRPRRFVRDALASDGGDAPVRERRTQVVFVVPDALLLSRAAMRQRQSGIPGLLRGLHEILSDPEQLRDEAERWEAWCEPRGSDVRA